MLIPERDQQHGSHGTVNPNWADTTVTFEYGLTASYGQTVAASRVLLGADNGDYSVVSHTLMDWNPEKHTISGSRQ